MGREQEPGADYGYDLVHEDLRAAAGRPDEGAATTPSTPAPAESAGDHGYDEAHDF